jgi:hypothetical protein
LWKFFYNNQSGTQTGTANWHQEANNQRCDYKGRNPDELKHLGSAINLVIGLVFKTSERYGDMPLVGSIPMHSRQFHNLSLTQFYIFNYCNKSESTDIIN